MSRWMGLHVFGLLAGLASASLGQPGGGSGVGIQNFGDAGADVANVPNATKKSQVCAVKIVSMDGKTTSGNLRLTSVVVGCSFGIYEIKPDKVREVRFDSPSGGEAVITNTGAQRAGSIVTTSGEVIEGTVLLPNWWRVETDLGLLAPNPDGLKSITFSKKTESPPSVFQIPGPGQAPPPTQGPDEPQLQPLPPGSTVVVPPATL